MDGLPAFSHGPKNSHDAHSHNAHSHDAQLELCKFACNNTPGTRGGPGGRDRTLAVKRRKRPENQFFFVKRYVIFKNIFLHRDCPLITLARFGPSQTNFPFEKGGMR